MANSTLAIVSFVLAGCVIAGVWAAIRKLNQLRAALTLSDAEIARLRLERDEAQSRWEVQRRELEARIAQLAKWEVVADAEGRAAELLFAAQQTVERANAEAGTIRFEAQSIASKLLADAREEAAQSLQTARGQWEQAVREATQLTAESKAAAEALLKTSQAESTEQTSAARMEARKLRDEARSVLESASIQAKAIVEAANQRAETIAGSAYEAMKNAELYEQTVRAMKNLISGYGDAYLIPERSLLDQLADDFSHTQAGEELKRARERTRAMVRAGAAASCQYVESSRRNTAINFVTDAFNGKVDSILSRVRHDNVGTLSQEVQDAFVLVNFNGKAFRDAKITEEFLGARLSELKWAVVAHQLKLEEREEQRRIKEQIREEERARREYERAIRDAAKEEELLRKAMEKAYQKVQQASEAQKAQYELQLADLAERLKAAEERSQRALSMAQQTRRGHVYVVSNVGSFGGDVYKIGLTRRLEPLDRIRELGDSSVPFEFDVHAMIFAEDAPALENQLHKHFLLLQMNKVNHRKEFFRVGLQHVREEVEKLGLSAKWTMTAEAREFRETLAIEKAIKDDPALREAWIKRQLELDPVSEETELEVSPSLDSR
jgi:hypothetical protein